VNRKITAAAAAGVTALGITAALSIPGGAAQAASRPAPERQLVFQVTVPAGADGSKEVTITEVCAFQSQTAADIFYDCAYQTRK
jgi:hypothetical protein